MMKRKMNTNTYSSNEDERLKAYKLKEREERL